VRGRGRRQVESPELVLSAGAGWTQVKRIVKRDCEMKLLTTTSDGGAGFSTCEGGEPAAWPGHLFHLNKNSLPPPSSLPTNN